MKVKIKTKKQILNDPKFQTNRYGNIINIEFPEFSLNRSLLGEIYETRKVSPMSNIKYITSNHLYILEGTYVILNE